LLPDAESDDPVIEIRGDLSAQLVLVDVDGELVILRASGGGYDAVSGGTAVRNLRATMDATSLAHLLGNILNLRFE